jgi:hypothetical protein
VQLLRFRRERLPARAVVGALADPPAPAAPARLGPRRGGRTRCWRSSPRSTCRAHRPARRARSQGGVSLPRGPHPQPARLPRAGPGLVLLWAAAAAAAGSTTSRRRCWLQHPRPRLRAAQGQAAPALGPVQKRLTAERRKLGARHGPPTWREGSVHFRSASQPETDWLRADHNCAMSDLRLQYSKALSSFDVNGIVGLMADDVTFALRSTMRQCTAGRPHSFCSACSARSWGPCT